MDVQFGPNSVDEPNLLYKLQHKIKVFDTQNPLQNRGYNLVASSSKYGILFVAIPNGLLTAYQLNQVIDKECELQHTTTKLQEMPTHIGVNCNQELLAVTGGQLICVYKVADFQNQNTSPAAIVKTEASPSTFVCALQWNPCNPDSIAMAFYDGTLLICQVSTNQLKKVQSKARCICWSPKGKQLVTGNSDGTLCQYLPELTIAKTVAAPNLFEGCPVEAMAIHWISTFQFAVVYKNATDNSRPAITIVNAGKTGQPTCMNYEDICFSLGSNRPWYYYLQGIAQWNIILASSSNSMEVATLGSPDGAKWMQWCQPDEARPELPLTNKKLENYPVGVCIDTCAIHQLPWGENEVLPHMPRLHVLSHSGLLTVYNIVNINKDAAQLCTPPQQIILPATAITNVIPSDIPTPAQAPPAPVPAAVPLQKPQPLSAQAPPIQIPSVPKTSQFMPSMNNSSQPAQQTQATVTIKATVPLKQIEQKETKPVVAQVQPQPLSQPQQPQPAMPQTKALPKTPQPPQIQENAALKAEQEKINKEKANQELKNMLIKEVNDFQMELYKFMVKTRETQAKLQHDIEAINLNIDTNSLNTEQLRKECSLEELRGTIVQFKLELVRACAVVAEARTHAEAKDLEQWTQVDPLTIKRISSVKKLAYYVQNQLEQARQALDYRWNEMETKEVNYKPGSRMIRPRLDEVYQLLVRQQEILGRQQAVLRTLRNTVNECDTPSFKSTSILRSTPFRNKDPLSKLTKNILNMSIEPQAKKPVLTAQKVDALRDLLSNHKPIKIKPVNVELRQHLATMKLNYEKSMREKEIKQQTVEPKVKTEPVESPKFEPKFMPAQPNVKVELKPEPVIQFPASGAAFAPVVNAKPSIPAFGNVARTLFNDGPKPELPKPSVQPTIPVQNQPYKMQSHGFAPLNTAPASAATKNVLKDLLQNKSQANLEAKNDANTFMGQKICSPTSFTDKGFAPPVATTAPVVLKEKPLSTSSNVFPKFQPQAFIPESKPPIAITPKSSETGEFEVSKPFEVKNTNIFGSSTNVPDVLKSHNQETKVESKPAVKLSDKIIEKSKENIPEKEVPKTAQSADKNDDASRVLSLQTANIQTPVSIEASSASSILNEPQKVEIKEVKPEIPKPTDKSDLNVRSSASSIFANANISIPTIDKPLPAADTPQNTTKPEPEIPKPETTAVQLAKSEESDTATTTSTSSSSIFATAATLQQKTTTPISTAAPSILSDPTPITTPSAFSSPGSIFGTTSAPSSVFATSSAQSVFSEASKPSIFSTPSSASSSIFGTAKTQTGSIFASTTTQAPPFGTATTTQSAFSSPSSVFGTAASTQSSLFGGSSSIFGTAATTTQSSLFSTPATSTFSTSTTSSLFGSVTTTTTAQSIFGATPATQASVFGSTGQTSVFGSAAATTQPSVFGASGQTTSVFGAPTSTTQSSVFGTPTPTTQPSVFGPPTPTTQPSAFGTPTPTSQPSVFGSPTSTTQPSVFGTPTPSTQASIFGTPTQTTQTSVFGAPPATTAQSGSLFGGAEANLFASASISTTNSPSQSGGSIFGGSSSGSVFGSSNTNVFGGNTTFGQPNPTAAAIFGGAASSTQPKPATNFWSGGSATAGNGFGSSAFGQQSTTQASSIFGSGSGGSFSSPPPAGTTAFGSPQQGSAFGAASSFGGSPVFGSKPVFGQTTGSPTSSGFGGFGGFNKSPTSGFGGPAAFGAAPTFGSSAFGNTSPGKGFGGTPAPAFGSPTQSNARFESLASQNTLTFGNLAQQSGQPAHQPPSFNTSPSFTGWRG